MVESDRRPSADRDADADADAETESTLPPLSTVHALLMEADETAQRDVIELCRTAQEGTDANYVDLQRKATYVLGTGGLALSVVTLLMKSDVGGLWYALIALSAVTSLLVTVGLAAWAIRLRHRRYVQLALLIKPETLQSGADGLRRTRIATHYWLVARKNLESNRRVAADVKRAHAVFLWFALPSLLLFMFVTAFHRYESLRTSLPPAGAMPMSEPKTPEPKKSPTPAQTAPTPTAEEILRAVQPTDTIPLASESGADAVQLVQPPPKRSSE